MGEKHQRLEAALREYWGVENVALLTNGHLALENIIQAMELRGGDNNLTLYLCLHYPTP